MKEEKKPATARYRQLGPKVYGGIAAISVLMVIITINQLFHLRIFGFMILGNGFYYTILAGFGSLAFLIFPSHKRSMTSVPWYDWVLFAACIGSCTYFAVHALNIIMEGWDFGAPLIPTILSGVIWVLALEGIRRAVGYPLMTVCLVFSVYPLFAEQMPGLLFGIQFSIVDTMTYHAMSLDNIIGVAMRAVGDLLIGFMYLGVALMVSGGGRFFINFANALLGRFRGGPAKVAVVSSALYGSLTGSVVSNVVTTGSMTIPAMKKCGYHPEFAGAVEACSSTGGCVMPPIMGVAAFIMASLLGVPYIHIAAAAMIPALLYYAGIMIHVDIEAVLTGLRGLTKSEIPSFRETLKTGWFFLGTLLLLVYLLLYLMVEAWAPFFAIIFLFACAMIRKETRLSWRGFVAFFAEGGKLMAEVTMIVASIGLIVGALSMTGLGNAFARELVHFAGGNLALILILTALASFILGMGMTVTACYIFLAVVVAPALIKIGLHPIACHLFIMYWGMLSYLTPPVCLAPVVAAAIAEANMMRTAIRTMKLALVVYIIPFFFVISPTLIGQGEPLDIVLHVLTAFIGVYFLVVGLTGYMYGIGRLQPLARVAPFAGGLCLLYPAWQLMLVGLALVVIGTIPPLLGKRRRKTGLTGT